MLRSPRVFLALMLLPLCLWTLRSHSWANSEIASEATASLLLELLKARKYGEIDTRFMAVQHAYERDATKAEELLAFARWAYQTDPALEPFFTEWMVQQPKSYAATLARGSYYRTIGNRVRGGEYINNTSEQQLEGMTLYMQRALADLHTSLKLTPKPILSYLNMIDVGQKFGVAKTNRELLEEALRLDPHDFIVRRKYLYTLRPQWGGSFAQMEAFVTESKTTGLPAAKLKTLAAIIPYERALAKHREEDYPGALQYYIQALEAEDGSDEKFLILQGKATIHENLKQYAQAVETCTLALQQNPNLLWALKRRGFNYAQLDQQEKAFKDYHAAAVMGDGWALNKVGTMYWFGRGVPQDQTEALRWFELGASKGDIDARHNMVYARQLMCLP